MSRSFFSADVIDQILVIRIERIVSSLADEDALSELEQLLGQVRTESYGGVVIDFNQIPYFGSSMLEALRNIWNQLLPRQAPMVLCNLSSIGRDILRVSKLEQLWPCVTDLVTARQEVFQRLSGQPSSAAGSGARTAAQSALIEKYAGAVTHLRATLERIPRERWHLPAPPGVWSPLQLICHLSDFDLVFADRMKRTIAEVSPLLVPGDDVLFAARLAYDQRDIDEEFMLMTAIHLQMSRILQQTTAADFARTGRHTLNGPTTLEALLSKAVSHIEHHEKYLAGKAQQPHAVG